MYNVLVIDDEKNIRTLLEKFLVQSGYQTSLAKNAEQAIEIIETVKVDTIVTDIIMPGLSGVELLKAIKSRLPDIPVIMITGMPDIETTKESLRAGAFDYLTKPVSKACFLKTINNAIKVKQLRDKKHFHIKQLEAVFNNVYGGKWPVKQEINFNKNNTTCLAQGEAGNDTITGPLFCDKANRCSKACCKILQAEIKNNNAPENPSIPCTHPELPAKVASPVLEKPAPAQFQHLNKQHRFHSIIGKSLCMQRIFNLIDYLSDTDTSVLISGASGTGKEMIAKELHYSSTRANGPLVTVNCSALSRHLLESELFGHTKGAFTGAIKEKKGRFQLADGGTIFLDEIGDISPDTQLKLLRVIQERTFEQVGDSTTIQVDVRVVAATNCSLKKKMQTGEFREDLYYRLNVVEIALPALKDRREDIPLLVNFFFNRFLKRYKRPVKSISDAVMTLFIRYPWPGNIRELEHAIEHAFVLCRETCIETTHLPEEIRNHDEINHTSKMPQTDSEAEKVLYILNHTGWNKTKAARILGVSRPTLYQKIIRLGLDQPEI